MEDFRIGAFGFDESLPDPAKDGSKKRSRPRRSEPQEELADEVTLSSPGDTDEQPSGYSPAWPQEEPK